MQSAMSMLAEQIASAVDGYRRFTGDYPERFAVHVARPSGTFEGKWCPYRVVISDVVLRNPDSVDLEDTDGNG